MSWGTVSSSTQLSVPFAGSAVLMTVKRTSTMKKRRCCATQIRFPSTRSTRTSLVPGWKRGRAGKSTSVSHTRDGGCGMMSAACTVPCLAVPAARSVTSEVTTLPVVSALQSSAEYPRRAASGSTRQATHSGAANVGGTVVGAFAALRSAHQTTARSATLSATPTIIAHAR